MVFILEMPFDLSEHEARVVNAIRHSGLLGNMMPPVLQVLTTEAYPYAPLIDRTIYTGPPGIFIG